MHKTYITDFHLGDTDKDKLLPHQNFEVDGKSQMSWVFIPNFTLKITPDQLMIVCFHSLRANVTHLSWFMACRGRTSPVSSHHIPASRLNLATSSGFTVLSPGNTAEYSIPCQLGPQYSALYWGQCSKIVFWLGVQMRNSLAMMGKRCRQCP